MLKYLIPLFFVLPYASATAQDYSDELQRASQLGLLLYEFDSSAWVATDALRDKKKAWKLYTETATPKGWVTTQIGKKRLRTAFVAELDGEIVSVFDAETKGRKVKRKTTYPTGRALTEAEQTQFRAKSVFSAKDIEPCAEFLPMNTVIIPSETGQGQYLYVMSSTQKPDIAVVGRHFRFRVSEDGTALSEKTGFTNSCLGLPFRAGPDKTAVGLITSHLKTPYPQENHVFLSLTHKIPVYVTIPETEQLWKVDGTSIKAVSKKSLGQ